MRPSKISQLFFAFVLALLVLSCQKEQTLATQLEVANVTNLQTQSSSNTQISASARVGEVELKVKPLTPKQISDIAKKLEKRKKRLSSETNRIDIIEDVPIDGEVPITTDEQEIQRIVSPLVQNGRQIHNEIISKVQSSSEWLLLTDYERNAILNITDDQAGELSLIYSTVDLAEWQSDPLEPMRMDIGTIRSCLSGALGLGDLYYLVVENPRALLSANGALKILKHVGLRYLGYLGLALAVWDFVDCVA